MAALTSGPKPEAHVDGRRPATPGRARAQRTDQIVGSLKEGNKADIIVLGRAIVKQAETGIFAFHQTEGGQTHLDGKLLHDIDRNMEPDENLAEQIWDRDNKEEFCRGVAVSAPASMM